MRAVYKFKRGKNAIEFRNDIPMPEITPEEVLIKNIAAGICSSDPKIIWQGYDDSDDWFVRRVIRPPMVVGAENFGEIAEVGKNVKNWKVGDRVCVEVVQNNCEQCRYCRADFPPMCPECTSLGRAFDGSFAEFYKAHFKYLHKVPDHVSPKDGSCVEMLAAVCTNLTGWTEIKPGDFVVVLGPGTIGQFSAQVAKARGAGTVLVTGTTHGKHRLEKAKELGADVVLNQDEQDPVAVVMELTKGSGADIVVGACEAEVTVNQALQMVRRCGTIAQIGAHFRKPIPVEWCHIFMKNLTIRGSDYHNWHSWERAIHLLASGKVKGAPLVSHFGPLEQWESLYTAVLNNDACTKAAIHP